MIFNELYDLRQYIISEVKVNCEFSQKDLSSDQYPIVVIMPDIEFDVFRHTEKSTTIDLPVNLKIVASQQKIIDAFKVLDRLSRKINQFNKEKGHIFTGPITPEYIDENSTYELNCQYTLKLLEHDTN